MLRTTPTTNHSPPATRGLTLVEMLISMAVTLVMMAAVVNLFANLGAGVKTQNASMELGTQLRLARARLFKDLAGATSAARPKLPSDDHDDGYLEIVEGQFSDKNPSGLLDGDGANGELDYTVSIVPSGGDPQFVIDFDATDPYARTPNPNDITNGGGLGDYDDILALTVRSESEPFVGRAPVWQDPDGTGFRWVPTTIESDLAEIIWYAVENPSDGSNGEPGMRTVYRRVLLIAPWVPSQSQPLLMIPPYTNLAVDTPSGSVTVGGVANDNSCFRLCDVSFRREGNLRVPNTLSDLTKRENRFAHQFNGPTVFPFGMDLSAIRIISPITQFPTGSNSVLHPFGRPFFSAPLNDRQGEDVMLNDVLAFDLRVYDPGAPLRRTPQPPPTGPDVPFTTLEPSDFAWDLALGVKIGFGSYVDLGWGWAPVYAWTANEPDARFYLRHQAGWHPRLPGTLTGYPCVYDAWPYHYENDGIDQDSASDNGAGIDQGTNGLDDILQYDDDNDPTTPSVIPTDSGGAQIAINGVDDAGERETAPPYNTPLRGMQVKLRVYDRDSRQIREATVTRNFVPQ